MTIFKENSQIAIKKKKKKYGNNNSNIDITQDIGEGMQ
jgi:hypothetical protein